ncbi:MAG TPA: DUF507 family protein [Candidatus Sumerlaeota bacterium]|nr:MAG: hypothetical protein BWZ08_00626 [candidate division BRC1 bacterium ADurb.BinA292]HOE94955.1 DUF507 family protein [Candidatus Sumerlaeota bacterium]HOR27236.1 DUF507 family protein [Candidatus Sumerlaeota bacterium]HPK01792.1 DUF507 family protein [Candidatus Sumerlaeota bacterium]
MRLSEDRINAIAYKIAFELVKKRYVKTSRRLSQVTAWVEKPILDNLRQEEALDEEVRRTLAGMKTAPPEGSFEYQALYQRKKEELARRRGYQL